MTLIREKPALLFYDSLNTTSVWQFMPISRLEITANSTYWKEDYPENSLMMLYDSLQKITL